MWKQLIDSKEAVIFDLDGTLVDSMGLWKQVDLDYFAMCNMEYPEDYQDIIGGLSMYETAVLTKDRYNISHSVEEMMQIWNDMAFMQYSEHVDEKTGVIEFLKYLKANNKKLGIATSNSKILCDEVLRKRKLIEYFDVIITGDECIIGKPAPDVYLTVARLLSASPEKCLVFEDLNDGIKAGKAAGMEVVVVKDDYSKASWEANKSAADYYINSYEEIINEICEP